MTSTAPCLRCGELISVDHEVEAGVAICEKCLREPAARRAGVRVDAPRPFLGLSPHDGEERRDVTQNVRAEQELRRRTEKLISANEQLRQSNIELKKAQAQLVHCEKLAALGTLTAGIAHEINNPLAFAVNNVAVLQRDIEPLLKILSLHDRIDHGVPTASPDLTRELAHLKDEADLPYLEANLPRLLDSTYKGLTRIAQIVDKLRGFARLDRAEVGEFDVNESIE